MIRESNKVGVRFVQKLYMWETVVVSSQLIEPTRLLLQTLGFWPFLSPLRFDPPELGLTTPRTNQSPPSPFLPWEDYSAEKSSQVFARLSPFFSLCVCRWFHMRLLWHFYSYSYFSCLFTSPCSLLIVWGLEPQIGLAYYPTRPLWLFAWFGVSLCCFFGHVPWIGGFEHEPLFSYRSYGEAVALARLAFSHFVLARDAL